MVDKLTKLIVHFNNLSEQMSDPEIISNVRKYTELAKEHRRLSPIISKANLYIETLNQADT